METRLLRDGRISAVVVFHFLEREGPVRDDEIETKEGRLPKKKKKNSIKKKTRFKTGWKMDAVGRGRRRRK